MPGLNPLAALPLVVFDDCSGSFGPLTDLRASFELRAGIGTLRERIERGTACPHGRPTALRITMRDLERNFGRA